MANDYGRIEKEIYWHKCGEQRMRVVSGKLKGKPLKSVPGKSTRPTADKVKEAMFNIIGPYFDGGICLDLFAGSGNLGIEALSRGMEKAIFVDRDKKAVQTIRDNLALCKLTDQAEVYRNDARLALKALAKREASFDLIFLDPPYAKQFLEELLLKIDEKKLLKTNGQIVCEHSADVKLPNQCSNLVKRKEEIYGIMGISIYTYING